MLKAPVRGLLRGRLFFSLRVRQLRPMIPIPRPPVRIVGVMGPTWRTQRCVAKESCMGNDLDPQDLPSQRERVVCHLVGTPEAATLF